MICRLSAFTVLFLCLVSAAYAEEKKELEPLHQLLDRVEKAWQEHDIDALGEAYSDTGFLLIADTPKGALVLDKAQALESISKYWGTVSSHQFVERNIQLDRDLAWMQVKIADRRNNRTYPITPNLICAVRVEGKWKMCFGMPSFFQFADPLRPEGSAQIVPADQPHPIKDIMLESFKGTTTGDVVRGIEGICQSGFIAFVPSENGNSTRIFLLKDVSELWERRIKDFRKEYDLSTAKLTNIHILVNQNTAVASGVYRVQKRQGGQEKISVPTSLDVFVRQNDTWRLAAVLPFRYEIASTAAGGTVLTSSQLEQRKEGWSGKICGIGVGIEANPKGLLINRVLPDSPAQAAGLREQDVITEIDGQSSVNLPVNDAADRIKGPEGTPVVLKVFSASGNLQTVTIKRGIVRVTGVTSRLIRPDTGLIAITNFNKETFADVKNALDQFAGQQVRTAILDLRESQGGMTDEMKRVAELFVPNGARLWMIQLNQQKPRWCVASGSYEYRFTVAVLIGQKTGAGELVAAALKGKPGITLLGQKTSGAARARGIEKLPDGQAQIVDQGIFLSGPKRPITGQGVSPDVLLPPAATPQEELDRAIKELDAKTK